MQDRALLALGLLVSSLNLLTGAPLAAKWIGINGYYGWRTSATLRSAKLWYEINARLGWAMMLVGVFGIGIYIVLELDVFAIRGPAKGILLLSIEGIATLLVSLIVGLSASDT